MSRNRYQIEYGQTFMNKTIDRQLSKEIREKREQLGIFLVQQPAP